MKTSTLTLVTALAIALASCPGTAAARVGDPENAAPRPPRNGDMRFDPQVLRQRLAARLSETERLQERLQTAIDRLDSGEEPDLATLEGDRMNRNRGERIAHGDRGEQIGRGGQRGNGGPRPPEVFRPLSPDDRARMVEFLKEHLPRVAARMESVGESPEMRERVLARFAGRVHEVMDLKDRDPELFALRIEEMQAGFDVMSHAREFSTAVRSNAAASEITRLEDAVRSSIGRRVNAQLAAQRLELAALAKRMQNMQAEIDRKTTNRDETVAKESANILEKARTFEGRKKKD